MPKTSNKIKGKLGEEIARKYLEKEGYEIIETNWHFSKFAEIDIIAKHKDSLVFVEVKYRKTIAFGHPLEAITKQKLGKIFLGIEGYLQNCKTKYKSYRIDVISIVANDNNKIEHLKNISF